MPEEEGKQVHQGVFDAGTDFSFVPALAMVDPYTGFDPRYQHHTDPRRRGGT